MEKHNITQAERRAAIQTFTGTGNKSPVEKKAAIQVLKALPPQDEIAVRTLILALEDPHVKEAARTSLLEMLHRARSSASKEVVMRHLTASVFDRFFDQEFEGHKILDELIHVATSKENIPETNDLVAWLLLDAGKGRKMEHVNQKVSHVLVDFLNRDFLPDNLRSRRAFQEAGSEIILRSLIEPHTASGNFILEALHRFSNYTLPEVSFEIIAAHATLPFKLAYDDQGNREIIRQCIANLHQWAGALSQSPDKLLQDLRLLEQWLGSTTQDPAPLPLPVLHRVGLNCLIQKPVSDLLTDKKPNLADKSQLFEILANLHTVRSWAEINKICTYIEDRLKNRDAPASFPFPAAISFLTSQLVGLNRFQHLTQQEEDRLFGRRDENQRPQRLQIDAISIRYAERINHCLKIIVSTPHCPLAARKEALAAIIRPVPHQLLETIQELSSVIETETELRKTLYQEFGNIRYIDGLALLKSAWESRHETENKQDILKALGQIGTRQLLGTYREENGYIEPDFLLLAAFEEPDAQVREQIKNTLIRAGFQPEIEREERRRKILELTEKAEQTARKITESESQAHRMILDINDQHAGFGENLFLMRRHIYNLDLICTNRGCDLLETGIDAAEWRSKLSVLEQKARALNTEIRGLTNEVIDHQSHARKLNDEINGIQTSLGLRDKEIENEKTNIRKAEEQQKEAEKKILNAQENIQKTEREKNQATIERSRLKGRLDNLETQRNGIRDHLTRLLSSNDPSGQLAPQIEKAKQDLRSFDGKISQVKSESQSLISQINQLDQKLRQLNQIIAGAKDQQKAAQSTVAKSAVVISRIRTDTESLEKRFAPLPLALQKSQEKINHYRIEANTRVVSLEAIKQEINLIRDQIRRIQNAQEQTARNFTAERDEQRNAIDRYSSRAAALERSLFQLKDTLTQTQTTIENDKTNLQQQIQLQETYRRDFDELGDRCFEETFRANQTHLSESLETRLNQLDQDLRSHFLYQSLKTPDTGLKFEAEHEKAIHISKSKEHI